jgi:hypothetical protein
VHDVAEVVLEDATSRLLPVRADIVGTVSIHELLDEGRRRGVATDSGVSVYLIRDIRLIALSQ